MRAAFLDEALELLLRSRMVSTPDLVKESVEPLFTGTGALQSFGAKTQLCRALKLLTASEFADLNRIRRIRNQFAHSYVDADFDAHEVLTITSQLQQGIWAKSAVERNDMKEGRLRFALSVGYLAGMLHLRAGIKGDEISLDGI